MNLKKSFLIFIFILTSGCAELRIGEVYEAPPLQSMGMSCMDQLREQLDLYIKQEVPESEIGNFSRCLQTSLIAFKNHVGGEERDAYSPQELKDFIQKFFLTDQVINDETLNQLMVFKSKYTEGNPNELTHQEIDQIINLIQAFEEFMAAIYPYNDIFFGNKTPTTQKLGEGLLVLRTRLKKLLTFVFNKPFSIEEITLLTQEVQTLINEKPAQENSPVFKVLKPIISFVFNDSNKNEFLPEEWEFLTDSFMNLYSTWLYAQFGFKSSEMTQKVSHLSLSVEQLITFLKHQVQSPYFNQSIPQEKIFSLVKELHEAEIFPQRIRLTSLESVLQVAFGRILTQTDSDFTITPTDLNWFEDEYKRWKSIQTVINQIEEFSAPPQNIQLATFKNLPADVRQDFYSLFKFRNIFNEENSSDFNVYLANEGFLPPKGYKNLTMRSLYLSGVRGIQRGYAQSYPDQGITESELVEFLTDIYGLSEDLDIEGASSPPNASTFLAAHLITYASQGYYNDLFAQEGDQKIELLEQKEGIDFLSLFPILSSSMNTVYSTLQEFCESQTLTVNCFNSHILTALKNLQSLPHVIEEVSELSPEEEPFYKELLLKVTLSDEDKIQQALNQPDTYEITPLEIKKLIYGLIFQEAIFTRFDTNQDNLLESQEIDSAFPIYDGAISLALPPDRQAYAQAVYDYTVLYKSTPDTSMWTTNIQLFWYRWFTPQKQLTRQEVLEITAILLGGF